MTDTLEPTLSEAEIKRVWEGMLSAEIRACYFAELAERYGRLQRNVTWGTLVLSSGAFAAAVLELPAHALLVRSSFALGAAALSGYSLVQQNQKRATDAADLHFRWNRLARDYEKIWENVYADDAAELLESLADRASEISKAGTSFPDEKPALLKWQAHVESHRLNS